MSTTDYFSHQSLDGRSFVDRAQAQGYPSPGSENIATGQNFPEGVMDSRMNLEGYRSTSSTP